MKHLFLIIFISFIISCDPLGSDNGGTSEFIVDISGAFSTSIQGSASHGIFTPSDHMGIILQLLSDNDSPILLNFTGLSAAFHEPSSYPVVEYTPGGVFGELSEGSFHAIIFQEAFDNLSEEFTSELGTISITDYSESVIEGNFEFEAQGYEFVENDNTIDTVQVNISVLGEFTSVRGEML